MSHVDLAFDAVQASPRLIILLGIAPTAAEVQYDWIEPGESIMSWFSARCLHRIRHFYEKPSHVLAESLYVRGCLWNSFVLIANTVTLGALCQKAFPRIYTSFNAIWPKFGTQFETKAASVAYNDMPSVSFSEAVLGNYFKVMTVLPVSGCQWIDLGTPERLVPSLKIGGHRGLRVALPGAAPIAMATKVRRTAKVGHRAMPRPNKDACQ